MSESQSPLPSPQDPQAYYKLLVGGPKRPLDRGESDGFFDDLPAFSARALADAFRGAMQHASRRLGEARKRMAA